MGRPTSERKGKTVIVRISDELHERLKRESENENVSLSEYAREILDSSGKCNTKNSELENLKEENNVLQNEIERLKREKGSNVIQNSECDLGMDERHLKDLKQMCERVGVSLGEFMERVYELFGDGKIYIDGTVIKTRGECDLRELEEMCHRFNADPQEMIDKLVKSLTRG